MMKRVVEKPMTNEEKEAYNMLGTLNLVDSYFLSRALELCPEGRLLDVGCGNGKMLRSVRGSYELHGIDIDGVAIAKADNMKGNISYKSAPAEKMPYKSNSFDLVMCHSTLHHMEDPSPAIEEMLRVANPKGAVLIRDLARPATEEVLRKYLIGFLAMHYDETNKRLFADSLRSSMEYSEWGSLFPEGITTSQVFFYNVAERAAEEIKISTDARKIRELEFIVRRIAAPIISEALTGTTNNDPYCIERIGKS